MLPLGTPDTWSSEPPMSMLETLGIFVGLPVGLFIVIAVLVAAPSWVRGSSYKPGLSWWAAPQWFGARPESASEQATPAGSADESEQSRGGVGARW